MGDNINNTPPDLNLRSEEVQEIMGRVPHWILRRGITLIFLIVLLLILGSWFFRYPDKVTAEVHIVSSIPSAHLTAQTAGCLTRVNVHNGDIVRQGQLLAVMQCSQEGKNKMDSIFSSMQGIVNTPRYMEEGMPLSPNTTLFVITPLQSGQIRAYGQLSAADFVRVKKGQKVLVRAGVNADDTAISGTVRSVSAFPNESGKYFFDLAFEKTLSQTVSFKGEVPATAEIIVNDKRLVENILQPVAKIIKR